MYTTFSQLQYHSSKTPNKIALIDSDISLSYIDLMKMICQAMQYLREEGVVSEDFIGVETQDPIAHLIGCIAVMEYGAIAVPLPRETSKDFIGIVSELNIKVIITKTCADDKSNNHNYICVDPVTKANSLEFKLQPRNVISEDIAMIYHTSGTSSGIRKGVMQSYRMLFETAEYISEVMQMTDEVIEYIASPIDNVFWFGRCRVVMRNGGTLVLNKGVLNPFDMLLSISKYHVNSISGDTSIFIMLLHHMKLKFCSVGKNIKWVKMASQAMHIDDKKDIIKCLPNARIIMNYGLTEAMRCTLLPFNDYPDKLNSVGISAKGVKVKIVNDDAYSSDVGEIFVSGVNVCSGYVGNEKLWNKKYVDGWYATGDIGYLDKHGFLYISGRKDDALNIDGKTIAPLEIEETISKYIQNELVVILIDGPEAKLVLVIQGEIISGMEWSSIRMKLLVELQPAFVPKELYVADKLPKTSNGKVKRGNVLADIINMVYGKYDD